MVDAANVTSSTFAATLLARLGLPTSAAWQDVVDTWVRAEGGYSPATSGGAAANNPLNANCDWPGQIGCQTLSNGAKVGVYGSLSDAVTSYATGLQKPYSSTYIAITSAASPLGLANAISASSWAGSHYSHYTNGSATGIAALLDPTLSTAAQTQSATTASQLSLPPSTIVTSDNIQQIAHRLSLLEVDNGIANPRGQGGWVTFLTDFLGHPISDAYSYINLTNTSATSLGAPGAGGTEPLTVNNAVTDLATAFGSFAQQTIVNTILIGVGILLIVVGVWTLVKGNDTVGKSIKDLTKLTAVGLAARQGTPVETSSDTVSSPEPVTETVAAPVGAGRGQDYSPETPREPRKARPSEIRSALWASQARINQANGTA